MAITNVQTLAKEPEYGGLGHNRPPITVEAKAAFDDYLDQKEGFRARLKNLDGIGDRASATSEETLAKCGETVVQIRAAMSVIDLAHKTTKQPYWDAGKVIDAEKTALLAPLEEAKRKIEGKQAAYLNKMAEARKAREKKAREEQEAIEAAHQKALREAEELAAANNVPVEEIAPPPPPPPPPAPVAEKKIFRGAEGAAISGKTVWKSRVDDYSQAFVMVQSNQKVREAIDAAVAALVRGGIREIPGCQIWDEIGVSNR